MHAATAGRREWIALVMLALPTLLIAVDNSVLFLALPHLSAELLPSSAEQLWIVDIYGFVIAGFLVTMGAVGDRIGHRRLLLIGAAAFGAASVLAAYSVSAPMLIATRALLGLAGAALMPASLALIGTMFRVPTQRAVAIAVWMSCFMAGGAIGPVVGGVLLEWFYWGSVFLMGVPVMALVLLAAPALVPEHRVREGGRIDLVSAALSVAAILPVIYGLKEVVGNGAGWSTLLAVAVGVGLGVLFVRRQRRLGDPMLDLGLFGNRSFSVALGIVLLGMVLQGGVYFLVSQYVQLVKGLSPLVAGLWLMPPALALVVGSMLTPALARRVRPATVIGGGLVVAVVGFLLLSLAETDGGLVLPITGMAIGFLGTAPIGVLGVDLIVGSAPAERAGAASSVAEMAGELGVALGIALLGSVATAVYRARVADSVPAGTPADAADAARDTLSSAVAAAGQLPADLLASARAAFTAGLTTGAIVSAVASAGLAVLAVTALRHLRPSGETSSEEENDPVSY